MKRAQMRPVAIDCEDVLADGLRAAEPGFDNDEEPASLTGRCRARAGEQEHERSERDGNCWQARLRRYLLNVIASAPRVLRPIVAEQTINANVT
jgi:hypothetical protein